MVIVKLPVAVEHVGCVTELNIGWTGVTGCVFTVTLADETEVHGDNVAVTVYVPAGAVTVFPDIVTPVEGETA